MSEKKDTTNVEILNTEPLFTDDYKKEIAAIIQGQLLATDKQKYMAIKARAITKGEGKPDQYMIYLLDDEYYCLSQKLVKIVDDKKLTVSDADYSPDEHPDIEDKLNAELRTRQSTKKQTNTEDQEEESEKKKPTTPTVDFFIGTPMPANSPAAEAAAKIETAAKAVGLTPQMVIGDEATTELYKSMLKAGLKGFVNIGHGSPNGIMLADGTLSYTWVNRLADEALTPEVVYFNSCETYNTPLWTSVTTKEPRTYIAGIIKLRIGPSDECTTEFWQQVLHDSNPETMLKAVNEANDQYTSKTGNRQKAFGLALDGGLFEKSE